MSKVRKVRLVWCDDCDRWELMDGAHILVFNKSKRYLKDHAILAGWEIING